MSALQAIPTWAQLRVMFEVTAAEMQHLCDERQLGPWREVGLAELRRRQDEAEGPLCPHWRLLP